MTGTPGHETAQRPPDHPATASASASAQWAAPPWSAHHISGPPPVGAPAIAPADGYGQYGPPTGFTSRISALGARASAGIVPLRPLTFAEIYDGAFRAIRGNPGVMLGISAVVYGVLAGLYVLLSGPLTSVVRAGGSVGGPHVSSALAAVGTMALGGIGAIMLAGPAICSVSESVVGRQIGISEVWRRTRRHLLRLVGAALLTAIVGGVGLGTVLLAVGLLGATSGAFEGSLVLTFLVLPFVALGLIVAVSWLAVRFLLAAPVIVLEGAGVLTGMKRSWKLTRGYFWRTFGLVVLTVVLLWTVLGFTAVPVAAVVSFLAAELTWLAPILTALALSVALAAATPFCSSIIALVYIDIRMRTEGLDVMLAQQIGEA